MTTRERADILQGTLDMLVLKTLRLEPMHGWGITERIEQWSEKRPAARAGHRFIPRCTGSSGRAGSDPSGG